ncbi:MAG TPA: D-glycerate dehydrogenase [Acidimicrobiia bacterium]|nr:D-glycerate dehydrogenase [Acidimicrobiia bacterium]
MSRIVVTRRLPEDFADLLDGLSPWVWDGDGPMPHNELTDRLVDADGVLTMIPDQIDSDVMGASLKVISQMAVGTDNIDLAAATARGIAVGHTPGVLTETTADTAWALLAAAVRRLPEGAAHVRAGLWGPWDPTLLIGGDLHDATLGVVGLGRIGAAVARRASGFGMRLLYTGPSRKPLLESRLGVAYRSFDELLTESDHVVITAPLNEDTLHLFDAAALGRMKPGSVLVNVSRGSLIDTDALVAALKHGPLAAAGLDVVDPEPIGADHPLVGLANCLIVPHIGSASHKTRRAMAEIAVTNLVAGLEGRRLPYCANPSVYD